MISLFRKKDFGVYACKARNSLGEAQATVQLQGKLISINKRGILALTGN